MGFCDCQIIAFCFYLHFCTTSLNVWNSIYKSGPFEKLCLSAMLFLYPSNYWSINNTVQYHFYLSHRYVQHM